MAKAPIRPGLGRPDAAMVVYDARTGRILLVHQVTTVPGGNRPSPADVETEALRLARAFGAGDRRKLAVLPVDPAALGPGEPVKVDVKRRRLVSSRRRTGVEV